MYYYRIIPSVRLPYDYLTYGSDHKLSRGKVVTIPVRNKIQHGIVDSIQGSIDFEESKMKFIAQILPFCLNEAQMKFLFIFAFNTFNKVSVSSNLFLQPFKMLAQKDIILITQQKEIQNINQLNINTKTTSNSTELIKGTLPKASIETIPKITYELENNLTFRIRYIIRSIVSTYLAVISTTSIDKDDTGTTEHITTLFLFPEFKLIKKIYAELISQNPELKDYIYIYTGTKDKNSKRTINSLLSYSLQNHRESLPIIVFGLRSSLFLPYPDLSHIYCIDEGSPYYIQEQNSIYYDARDSVFLMSNAYETSLTFISTLPSIRLQKLYSDKSSEIHSSKYSISTQKRLTVQITNSQAKFPKNSLFSEDLSDILSELTSENEDSAYFSLDSNQEE